MKKTNRYNLGWVIVAIMAVFFFYGCKRQGQEETAPVENKGSTKVVAKLNGEPIYEQQILHRIATAELDPQQVKQDDPQRWARLVEAALDGEMLDRLILTAAEKEQVRVADEEVEAAFEQTRNMMGKEEFSRMLHEGSTSETEYRDYLRKRLLIDTYKDILAASVEVPEETVQTYFEGHADEFKTEEKFKLAVIVLDSAERAEELYRRVESGEEFDALLAAHSKLSGKDFSGRTRLMPLRAMPAPVRDIVADEQEGSVLPPVTNNGEYYVIKILEHQPARKMSYDETQQMVAEFLRKKREKILIDEWYRKALEEATVEYVH